MTGSQGTGRSASRRTVVAAAGAAGLAAALAACGESGEEKTQQPAGGADAPSDPAAPEGGGGGGGVVLGKTADIPEGGGVVFKEQKVVVTQPAAGQYKAFSATCTHAGCSVTDVAAGTINCACHGSKFAIADGSVKKGPATQALPGAKITVEGDSVKLG
jgi:Rieske Fe-S protein